MFGSHACMDQKQDNVVAKQMLVHGLKDNH